MKEYTPAETDIEPTKDVADQMMIRQRRLVAGIDRGLQVAQGEGMHPMNGFKYAVASAIASEIEHLKREVMIDMERASDPCFVNGHDFNGKETCSTCGKTLAELGMFEGMRTKE